MTTTGMTQYSGDQANVGSETQVKKQANMADSLMELYAGITGGKAVMETLPEANKGVLAGVINGVTGGTTVIRSALDSVNEFLFGHKMLDRVFSLIAVLLSLLFLVFVQGILKIGERRFILENRLYHRTRIYRIFFLYRQRNLWQPAKVMILRVLFTGLWALTIVGGFIKYYQYKMIPYILAENPDIHWKDAFRLTKEMTDGQKWRMFCLQMSFAGWFALMLLTGGLVGVFFSNPYYRATEAELYVKLRERVIEVCSDESIFFEDNCLIYPPEGEAPEIYPGLAVSKKHEPKVEYRRDYTIPNLALMFMAFAIVGWIWEVLFYFVQDGTFVNRGTMHGPWLPIYGTGGVVVLIVLKKLREKPIVLFFSGMAVCGTIEYFTSWYLEVFKDEKYWDYTGYFMNINGRVCLEGLLVFGIACVACVYLIAPRVDKALNKMPPGARYSLLAILWAAFGADAAYSHFHPNTGKGITDDLK